MEIKTTNKKKTNRLKKTKLFIKQILFKIFFLLVPCYFLSLALEEMGLEKSVTTTQANDHFNTNDFIALENFF